MSTDYREGLHPRTGDGRFTTKAVSEADGGLQALADHSDRLTALAPEPEAAHPPPPETPFTRRYDTLDEKLAAFHDELANKVESLATDEGWNAYLTALARFPRYSMSNQLLIAAQRPDATRVAGYRAWQQMGRHVDKGEKAIQILAPKTVRADLLDDAGNPRTGPDGKKLKGTKVIGFTTASVFDLAQTSGEPLPSVQRELTETPPPGFVDDLEGAIRDSGFEVVYAEIPGEGHHGWTEPSTKRVVIDQSLTPGSRAATLAHELAHIKAGHIDRTDEYHTGSGGHRGQMEVEAEAVAHVLCRANGMLTPADTAGSYVAGWARSSPTSDVVRASAQSVSKVVKDLLTNRTWANHTTD